MRKVILTIASGVVCLSITTGCASWTSDKPKSKNSMWSSMQFWKKTYQAPSQLAAIWTPDTLTMSGKPPTRGFGGRIYFYNADSKAIAVEGELIVHGYEEPKSFGKALPAKREADKTFVFTQEQFSSHFSPSELGASYSIWIPWDGADGMQREICLIPSFKGSDGSIVQGEPAKLVLQGRTMDPDIEQVTNRFSIQESHSPTVSVDLPNANRGLRTTTISVPNQSNRMVNNAAKSKSQSTGKTATKESGNLYGGVAVGGGSKGLASSSSQEMPTIVNDLNSNPNPLVQRSYNLTANTAAYTTALSSMNQNLPTQNTQTPAAQTSLQTSAPGQPTGTPNFSMPNMVQPTQGLMVPRGEGMKSPASYQNILPPQTLPNQASAPAFPVQSLPGQVTPTQFIAGQQGNGVTTSGVTTNGTQGNGLQWQPFGQAPIPLINPNAPHYSPYQSGNVQIIPASAINQATSQVQTADFNGIQPSNAVTTAWGQAAGAQLQGGQLGQQPAVSAGQPALYQR